MSYNPMVTFKNRKFKMFFNEDGETKLREVSVTKIRDEIEPADMFEFAQLFEAILDPDIYTLEHVHNILTTEISR